MPGIPVVIATNGRGIPVRQVTSKAPVMTVAANGKGIPIVISAKGFPFIVQGGASTAPAALTAGQWSIADAATGGTATVTISALPSNGGSAITAIQYQVGAGAWTASGISATGTFNITGLTNGASVNVKVRAVNAIGNGADSDVKSVTPTAGLVAFSDDFASGVNNADLSTRSGWTKVDGGRSAQTTGASSVKHVAGTAPDSAYVCTDLQTPKHYVECTWQSTANSTTFGIAGRMIDGVNYAAVRRNGTQWQLFTCIAGTFNQLGSSPQEILVGDVIRMEFDGDFVTCYRNGSVFIGAGATQLNAPTLLTATKAGTLVRAAISPLIGNFKAGGMA